MLFYRGPSIGGTIFALSAQAVVEADAEPLSAAAPPVGPRARGLPASLPLRPSVLFGRAPPGLLSAHSAQSHPGAHPRG